MLRERHALVELACAPHERAWLDALPPLQQALFYDLTYVAYEPESGYADPILTSFGFVRRAQELGARVKTHTKVTGIRRDHGRVAGVDTTDGPIDAPVVVLAGGAWANGLLSTLDIDLGLTPNRLQVVIFRWPITVGRGHMTFIDAINDTWFRPESGSGTLIGAEWIASTDSPDSYRETADPAAVASARDRLVARFPGMTEAPMRGGWARHGHDEPRRAPDHRPGSGDPWPVSDRWRQRHLVQDLAGDRQEPGGVDHIRRAAHRRSAPLPHVALWRR